MGKVIFGMTISLDGFGNDLTAPRVLMLPGETAGWALPHVHLPYTRIWLPLAGPASAAMSDLLAADVTVLRNLFMYRRYFEDRFHTAMIYILENHSDGWIPPKQARWMARRELETLPLSHPEYWMVIQEALQEAESDSVPNLRPLWARPGWFKAAAGWMRQQLTEQGYRLTAPIKQFKTGGISCLLRAETDRGDIFFKVATSLPLFGNEPALLKALSERFPEFVPAPIAIEPEQRWMLMADFGSQLGAAPSLERTGIAAGRFAQLQIQAVPLVSDLFAIGCLDRRLDVLAAQIDPLLNDDKALALLTGEEIVRIRTYGPRLKAMCRELAGYRVPFTLNHGDLHSGNITGETLLFFDWTDACIAHPFLDLSTLMMDLEYQAIPGGRERVLTTYLSYWTAYEPLERLHEMWRLAEPLGALHQAVSYQHIVAILEPASKPEMAAGIPDWVRRVIKAFPD